MKHLVFVLLAFVLWGCSQNEPVQVTQFSGVAMTIPYQVKLGDPLTEEQEKIISHTIAALFTRIHHTCDPYYPESEISKINQMEGGIAVPLSPMLYQLLKKTDQIVRVTEGRFDPTVAPLQRLWKRHFEQKISPLETEVAAELACVGWDKIHIVEGHLSKEHTGTELDLCGIAKGYAVDLLIRELEGLGFFHIYVEWGGEIRTQGTHPEGRPWTVFISQMGDPDPANAVAIVPLTDQALATSGHYYQRWECGGKIYTHILDPRTGTPLEVKGEGIGSATVLGPDCATADAIATTLMLFPEISEAEAFAERFRELHPDYRFWLTLP